jgi:NAD(P)-dependent dehydrogenase (short-subunit alcohol dehydrogenase family)
VRLDGRVAMVTGGGQGVGRGIALALADAGSSVVIAARRAITGEPVAQEIRDRGGDAVCVECDVTKQADVQRAVAAHDRLDILVHNALGGGAAPHAIGDDGWKLLSRTGMWGALHCARAGWSRLRDSGHGRFILLSSPAGIEGSSTLPYYAAVKGAQRALAKSLALEWGPDQITVNCIAPLAATPALDAAMAANPELRPRLEARTPLGRVGDAERDVGGVAVFLASDAAGYVTGQTIVCNGGGFTGL